MCCAAELLGAVQSTTVDGIYEGSATITGDFATVAYRLSLLGFNALRIPFSFQVGPSRPATFISGWKSVAMLNQELRQMACQHVLHSGAPLSYRTASAAT